MMTTAPARRIFCHYAQQETDGLEFVPYPGALGQRIFNEIGKNAWSAWLSHQTILINENRLSPRDPSHRAFLEQQMCAFLFAKQQTAPPSVSGHDAP